MPRRIHQLTLACMLCAAACRQGAAPDAKPVGSAAVRPALLLVTLDTTRADAIGPDAAGVETPAFNALAARGRRFRQAYAAVPETLPSHTTIMTGLYPAGHGVHQNARYLSADHPVIAEVLRRDRNYHTAAFVSSFVLARRFGLARGFDVYNDDFPAGRSERTARETTDAALAEVNAGDQRPFFLWVHYYDPHAPYTPPEPFKTRYAKNPYLGEVASMDEQLGRLVAAFDKRATRQNAPSAIVVVGDHGEGLGEHGEAQHGNLLYQATMHVPLVIVGAGITPGVSDAPVSTRRVFSTLLDWAGLDPALSLRGSDSEVVLGEAMRPFLDYGWQPQVMSVTAGQKAILAGTLETYDLAADPAEAHNLGSSSGFPAAARKALEDYPVPSADAAHAPAPVAMDEEAKRRLASLGYVSADVAPLVRKGAPRPADMAHLFGALDQASGLFVAQQYAKAIPLLQQILAADPYNLGAMLQLAAAHSALGHDAQAAEWFAKAGAIAPASQDVKTYLALHYARGRDWERAAPLLEQVLASAPDRLPALEALATIRERQGRVPDAIALWQRAFALRSPSAPELAHLGDLEMGVGTTDAAIAAFERARALDPHGFRRDLDLGVLYLAARRFADARDALDRVPASDPRYPMALFKRAQVSVLLHEPDQAARVDLARKKADGTTRDLIAHERLFQSATR